jgi:hypothetical protein
MLWGCSLSEWGSEHVTSTLAYNGGQYFIYKCLKAISIATTPYAIPEDIDILLKQCFPQANLQYSIISVGTEYH